MAGQNQLPTPLMASFITCDGILVHEKTHSRQLMNPKCKYDRLRFPDNVLLSLYVEITGGRGAYRPGLTLANSEDQTIWEWHPERSFNISNPLITFDISFNDLNIRIPCAGRYLLALQLNEVHVAQRSLWFDLEKAH
ncbi:MAG: hypothetical protein JNJ77_18805 [Planctomycetia bacterium]|nr:hypothetical protein [Planctomycetia bacterium]